MLRKQRKNLGVHFFLPYPVYQRHASAILNDVACSNWPTGRKYYTRRLALSINVTHPVFKSDPAPAGRQTGLWDRLNSQAFPSSSRRSTSTKIEASTWMLPPAAIIHSSERAYLANHALTLTLMHDLKCLTSCCNLGTKCVRYVTLPKSIEPFTQAWVWKFFPSDFDVDPSIVENFISSSLTLTRTSSAKFW